MEEYAALNELRDLYPKSFCFKSQIFISYRNNTISSENEFYIPVAEGIDFIITCDDNNLSVIGIEGFIQRGEMIQPDLNIIADFSENDAGTWDEYREKCNESALEFVKRLKPDRLLNFTLLSESEWNF